jgi:hypothetical protein
MAASGTFERKPGTARRWGAFGLGLIVAGLVACESATERPPVPAPPPTAATAPEANEDAWQSPSAAGRFRITIRPEAGRIPIGPLHAWIVTVETPDGRPAEVRQLVFDGGMPQHGHGLETKPEVTDRLGPGVFRVDGVRFHMAGSWQIRIDVAGDGAADVALFDVEVRP